MNLLHVRIRIRIRFHSVPPLPNRGYPGPKKGDYFPEKDPSQPGNDRLGQLCRIPGDVYGRHTDTHLSRLSREDTFVCRLQKQVPKGGRTRRGQLVFAEMTGRIYGKPTWVL